MTLLRICTINIKTMIKLVVVPIILLFNIVYTQLIMGNPCTHQSSNSPGICKLLTECQAIRDDVVFSQKLPQTCGFEGTQAIVCCPRFRRPGDISRKKCREYASYIEEKNECGHKIVKRIVGGEPAGRTEFPHMAMIIGSQTKSWLCGGSVISERYILTAAHYFTSLIDDLAKRVLLGVTNLNDSNHSQEIKIAEIIKHTEYTFPYNDIALLKLQKPIEINSYVRPACLYTKSQITATKAVAIGWGATDYGGTNSDDLLKVTLDIVDYEFCNKTYQKIKRLTKGIIDDMHICAGSGTDQKDTCQGDTGGSLQIRHNNDDAFCMYDVVGINSFGRTCSGGPSVFIRVSHYIKWIEDYVWPESTE